MSKKFTPFLIALVAFLVGCSTIATGPLFSEAPMPSGNLGVLYLYRRPAIALTDPIFKIDGKPFVKMGGLGYSYAYLTPGVHRLAIGMLSGEFAVEKRQVLFKRVEEEGDRTSIRAVPEEKAIKEMKRLEYRYVEPFNREF